MYNRGLISREDIPMWRAVACLYVGLLMLLWGLSHTKADLSPQEETDYANVQLTQEQMDECFDFWTPTVVIDSSFDQRSYTNYTKSVWGNNKVKPGELGYGCKLSNSLLQCDTQSVCQGIGQKSTCVCDTTPSRAQSSCSCRGTCRANTQNKIYNWQAPYGVDIPSWSVCDCNDGWFGERCQFKKSEVPMSALHLDSNWVDHFPFLPWYIFPYTADIFMDEVNEYNGRSNRDIDLERYSYIGSLVRRDAHQARTIWGYDDLKHACPNGMGMFGLGNGDIGNLQEELTLTNKPRRDFLFCSCISNVGCSGHGQCMTISLRNGWDAEWSQNALRPTQRAPPVPRHGFDNIKWVQNFGDSIGYRYGQAFRQPSSWTRCECQKDYQGLYCERDAAPLQRCGDGVTSYGNRSLGEAGIEDCFCDPTKAIPGFQKRRTGRDCGERETGCESTKISYQNKCILDKDKSECGNRGLYNAYVDASLPSFKSQLPSASSGQIQTLKDLYVCECRNADVPNNDFKWPANATQAANTPLQFIGRGCKESCRSKMCNNHGDCKFIRRTTNQPLISAGSSFPFNVPFNNYNEANSNPPYSEWVYDTTGCKCDEGYLGAFCTASSAGLGECQGFIATSQPDLPCNGRCVWPNGGEDITGLQRVVEYNEDWDICEVPCPKWLKRHFTDLESVPNGIECGGYPRGECGGVDTSNYERKCQCRDGYSGLECGAVSCPRIMGALVCGGSTRGWCDETKNTCVCKSGTYGESCQFNVPSQEDKCARGAQSVYNSPMLF